MQAALRETAKELFGSGRKTAPARPDQQATTGEEPETKSALLELHLTARQQIQLWDHVKTIENFWSSLKEIEPGIVARIASVAAARRWEVIFLTTRPTVAGETVQIQSQCWLDAHGFRFPSVYVVHRSRGKIADALQLDAVVDDRPENCLDVAVESKAKPILIWPSNPKHVPPGRVVPRSARRRAKRIGCRALDQKTIWKGNSGLASFWQHDV
jgi:hypothetical protein